MYRKRSNPSFFFLERRLNEDLRQNKSIEEIGRLDSVVLSLFLPWSLLWPSLPLLTSSCYAPRAKRMKVVESLRYTQLYYPTRIPYPQHAKVRVVWRRKKKKERGSVDIIIVSTIISISRRHPDHSRVPPSSPFPPPHSYWVKWENLQWSDRHLLNKRNEDRWNI